MQRSVYRTEFARFGVKNERPSSAGGARSDASLYVGIYLDAEMKSKKS